MSLVQTGKPKKQELLSSWVQQFGDELFSWAYFKTSDQVLAEDLVQDTFLAALQAIEKFQEKSSPKTWLFAILNRKITDFYRKRRRITLQSIGAMEKEEQADSPDQLFDRYGNWKKEHRPKNWETDDSQILDQPGFRETLQACLQKLPSRWLSVIESKYLEEKEGKEISLELGISTANYWQILHRAKLQLRSCLENNWFN